MSPNPQPRRSWLGVIQGLLLVMVVLDFFALPLFVLPNGAIRVGSVSLIDLWSNQQNVLPPRTHPEVFPDQVPILLGVHPSPLQFVLYKLGHGFVYLAVTIPILIYARRIAKAARTADPFTLAMVRRLRRLGLLILAGGALAELTSYLTSLAVLDIYLDRYHAEPLMRFDAAPDYRVSLWWVLPGLILLGVSEIVRRGVDLREELDTVI
jgi:hypothetical protein